jgi:hypothetical protein
VQLTPLSTHWAKIKKGTIFFGHPVDIPTKCTCYVVYFYLTIALHVSGIIITHLQEHKTTVTTSSANHYTVLLSVAIVEELKPV